MLNKDFKNSYEKIKYILSEIPFFEEFSNEEMDSFGRNLSLRSFPAHTTLIKKEDVGVKSLRVIAKNLSLSLRKMTGQFADIS